MTVALHTEDWWPCIIICCRYVWCRYFVKIYTFSLSKLWTLLPHADIKGMDKYLYPLINEVEGGYTGFTLSVRLSVHLSVLPSVCASVPLCRELCPLCIFYNIYWIHFIFTHLIKQLQKVCRVTVFFQNSTIWSFGKFFNFVTLTLSCFDLRSNMSWSIVWVIMGQWGVSSECRHSSFSSYILQIQSVITCPCPWYLLVAHKSSI